MGYYDIDYTELIRQLLPVRLRTAIHRAWLNAICAPIIYLFTLFTTYRSNNLYDLRHNGQVTKLEALLNELLETEGTIYITDYEVGGYVWLYLDAERYALRPLYMDYELFPYTLIPVLYLWRETEIIPPGFFVVHVDSSYGIDETRLRSLLNKYKLAGTQYIIEYY